MAWPGALTSLAARELENKTQEKESSLESPSGEDMHPLPRGKPCDTKFTAVLLHIEHRNVLGPTFYICILLGVVLSR